MMRWIVILMVALGVSATHAGSIYKCVDTNNRVEYRERPCTEDVGQSDVKLKSGATDPTQNFVTKYELAESVTTRSLDECRARREQKLKEDGGRGAIVHLAPPSSVPAGVAQRRGDRPWHELRYCTKDGERRSSACFELATRKEDGERNGTANLLYAKIEDATPCPR